MAQTRKMNANLFIAIKTLRQCGSSHSEIAESLKISKTMAQRACAVETMEEYFQQEAAIHAKYRAKDREKAAAKASDDILSVQPADPPKKAENDLMSKHYFENRVVGELRRQNEQIKEPTEILRLVSNKLAFCVDVWSK